MYEQITSKDNPKIKMYSKLIQKKYRDEMNMFIIEGHHLVEEAKKHNIIVEVLTSDDSIEGTYVSQDIINKLSTTQTPQKVIAICNKIESKELGNKVLVLDNVQDPGNVGTLIRSALSFWFDSVVVSGCDIYNSKVIRSSQGAFFHINTIWTEDISDYFEGYQLIGTLLDKSAKKIQDVKFENKFMLIMGNEGKGLSESTINKLDEKTYIDVNFESLNVAIAGSIFMYELSKK